MIFYQIYYIRFSCLKSYFFNRRYVFRIGGVPISEICSKISSLKADDFLFINTKNKIKIPSAMFIFIYCLFLDADSSFKIDLIIYNYN